MLWHWILYVGAVAFNTALAHYPEGGSGYFEF